MIYATYEIVKDLIRPGDVIAFSGKGLISTLIRWKTRSIVTHVGCMLTKTALIESTTLKRKKGVSIIPLQARVESYKGCLWWFPLLPEVRERMDWGAYGEFLTSHDGADYDTLQAIFSACLWWTREDFSKMFCSELVCGSLEVAGAIEDINCSEQTPIDSLRFPIFTEYAQIRGPWRDIGL